MVTEKQKANLKPIKTLSKEEAKIRGSKGGKNSVKSRQEKKELKTLLQEILKMQPTDKKKEELEEKGFSGNITNKTLFAVSLFDNGLLGHNKAIDILLEAIDGNEKKDLEIERLRAEKEKAELECEKLKRDLGNGSDSFEDLTPLADLISKKEK